MAYRDKYLKYKKKYLELTSELRGGEHKPANVQDEKELLGVSTPDKLYILKLITRYKTIDLLREYHNGNLLFKNNQLLCRNLLAQLTWSINDVIYIYSLKPDNSTITAIINKLMRIAIRFATPDSDPKDCLTYLDDLNEIIQRSKIAEFHQFEVGYLELLYLILKKNVDPSYVVTEGVIIANLEKLANYYIDLVANTPGYAYFMKETH